MYNAAQVTVGTKVEFTRDEQRQLEEMSRLLSTLAQTRAKGWLLPFVQTTTALNRLIQRAVERSHAS